MAYISSMFDVKKFETTYHHKLPFNSKDNFFLRPTFWGRRCESLALKFWKGLPALSKLLIQHTAGHHFRSAGGDALNSGSNCGASSPLNNVLPENAEETLHYAGRLACCPCRSIGPTAATPQASKPAHRDRDGDQTSIHGVDLDITQSSFQ
jgi:hypothetical protein